MVEHTEEVVEEAIVDVEQMSQKVIKDAEGKERDVGFIIFAIERSTQRRR